MKIIILLTISLLSFQISANATDATSPKAIDAAAAASEKAKDLAKAVKTNEVNSFDEFIKQVKDFEASDKFKPEILSTPQPQEVNVGKPDAPVKIVEYASLGCIHCKQFHQDVFYKLKKNYIDEGKVYYTYRHYPLNAPALKAAVVLSCVAPEDRLAFVGSLFEAQAQWAYSKSEPDLIDKLKTISKIAGLSDDKFEQCYKDEKVQDQIVASMKEAYDKLLVLSTPSIFINGKRFLESREYEGTAKYIDDLIAGKSVDEVRKAAEEAAKTSAKPAKVGMTPAKN